MAEAIYLLVFIAFLVSPLFLIAYILAKVIRKHQAKAFRKQIEWEEKIRQEVREEYKDK